MKNKWDKRFMDLAGHIAQWSKDPSTKVGAVIVDSSRRIVGTGYNGFPRGVGDDVERYNDKAVKYKLVVHAESNAIMNAVKSVTYCTLYTTKFPCSECVKQIIQQGIDRVVSPPPSTGSGIWAEDAAFSLQMLTEAGISLDTSTVDAETLGSYLLDNIAK